jgi:hypothetical protein
MSKSNPFDYTKSINQTKKNMMRGTANDKLAEKDYNPYLNNRALSYYPDTIFYSNEMNQRHHLDNILQYEYLLNIVRPRERYSEWAKKGNDGDVAVVKEYYGYNDTKARQALAILTDEQLSTIKRKMHKGGKDG